jgi:hypothetical protein
MPNNLYRRGKVWWARAQVSGSDIRKSLGTEKRAEAQIRLAAWLAKLNDPAQRPILARGETPENRRRR